MSVRVTVAGALAAKAGSGGEAWVRLSYALGLRRLGCRVQLVEDVRDADDAALEYASAVAAQFGLPYSTADDTLDGGDLLVNVSGNLARAELRARYARSAFVDIDPGFTQFWHMQGLAAIPPHDVYFTIGENIGMPECPIPTCGLRWRATRPPVVLGEWPTVTGAFDRFTTIANWRSPAGVIEPYGAKHHEWRRLLPLPERTGLPFEAALAIHEEDARDREALTQHGWRVVDPTVVATPVGFRDYVQSSGAEFSVAQGIYVETRSGWLSDRTARYLASGRPALVQETGSTVPTGDGLVTFSDLDGAAAGARRIAAEYDHHAHAARALAEEHLDADRVLTRLLEDALA